MYKKLLALVFLSLLWGGIAKAQTVTDDLVGLGMPPELAEYIAASIVGGTALGNDTYLKATDIAGTGTISLLKANATDDTVLNSDAGDPIIFQSDSDVNRLLTYRAASDTALTLKFGDGSTADQNLTISSASADAGDSGSLILAGGGAATSNGTRGAIITLPGEEVSGGSDITYNAGAGDTHIFQVAGTAEVTISDDVLAFAGASTTITTAANTLVYLPVADTNRRFVFAAANDTNHYLQFGDGGSTAAQTLFVNPTTGDADDDARIQIGGADNTRGAYIIVDGNEHSTNPGNLQLVAGNVGSGKVSIKTIGAQPIEIETTNAVRWQIEADGDIANNATTGGNIIFQKDLTGIIDSTEAPAAAGNALADATVLTANVTFVSAADGTKGVKFGTAPVGGTRYVIYNTANAALKVYPGEAGDQINAAGAGTAVSVAAYASLYCHASSAAQIWCGELDNA